VAKAIRAFSPMNAEAGYDFMLGFYDRWLSLLDIIG
jgi:hypothetical protein